MSKIDLKAHKLFPRNLTARADVMVTGNPVTTRPESGVENSWPGLEFDQRSLDKFFFPGLYFEYHDERGSILRDFDPNGPAGPFFTREDLDKGIFLAWVQGEQMPGADPKRARRMTLSFSIPAGLDNWRLVRDFEAGPVAVALCTREVYNNLLLSDQTTPDEAARTVFTPRQNGRHGDFVVLFGQRAAFLDKNGVIDPALIGPGELTRSMCSPWQFDFTDCGCFFWASNKPDMVSSADQDQQIVDFLRRDRRNDATRKPSDWLLKDRGNWDGDTKMNHVELLQGYETLKFVFGGKEADQYVPTPPLPKIPWFSKQEIVEQLTYLATVEHALCIEYLYAYYSLKLPPGSGPQREPWNAPGRPERLSKTDARIFTAGDEVLQIAIDEMRHFRLANEMLMNLDAPWQLGRAKVIGRDFRGLKGFNRPFELAPLTAKQLDWFIQVEKASPSHLDPETIDGMYTFLLRSIEDGPALAEQPELKDKLGQMVKIIIDEGSNHFHRFERVKDALSGISEKDYLRVRSGPERPKKNAREIAILQDTANASYAVLLRALEFVFAKNQGQRGALLEAARRAMYNIDDVCRTLSADYGVGAEFSLPSAVRKAAPAVQFAADVGAPLHAHFAKLRKSGHAGLIALGSRMEGKLGGLTERLEAASRD